MGLIDHYLRQFSASESSTFLLLLLKSLMLGCALVVISDCLSQGCHPEAPMLLTLASKDESSLGIVPLHLSLLPGVHYIIG
jgi:hypothetical protein